MKNVFRKIVNKILLPHSQLIYAQSGEDIIIAQLFHKLNISTPKYLDIGANHPAYISNTYYFYLRGSRGVCIEPNPVLFEKIKKHRPHDVVLNIGIGTEEAKQADFYLFPGYADGLSTFSKRDADYWQETGMKNLGKIAYKEVISIPLETINAVMKLYFKDGVDLLSIDIEGLDLSILQTLDFNVHRPKVICVETLYYDNDQRECKNDELIEFLKRKNYEVYADTHINTIFLSKNIMD